MSSEKICVVGLGYIGLPTACLFAKFGFQVHGVDINPSIVSSLNSGKSHLLNEPDMDSILHESIQSGKFVAALKPEAADLFIIAVPTPFQADYIPDLTYVQSAMNSILPHIRKGTCIALESTSPPGTTHNIIASEVKKLGFEIGKDVFIAYCPERVLPGQILKELSGNSRIIGGITPTCSNKVSRFYRRVVDAQVHETRAEIAEMVKLVENSYRDINIAFANEISMLCSHLDIDHKEVINYANHHPRVKILNPGPGVGGHCIAVDPWFLIKTSPENTKLMKSARMVNIEKTHFTSNKIKQAISKEFKRTGAFQKVVLYGLTYKPDVADFRESPSLEIYNMLKNELGNMADISAVDPYLSESEHENIQNLPMAESKDAAERYFSVCLVAHKEFQDYKFKMDFSR